MITIDISPSSESQLEAVAREHGKSKEEWARELILEYLEDLTDAQEAEETLKRTREGKEKTIPLREVMRDYDLDG